MHAPYALRTIIELRSEDGIVGISETRGGAKMLADIETVREHLIGRSACDLHALWNDVVRVHHATERFAMPGEQPHPLDVALRVYSALEVAALDLIGKSFRVPLYDLLGGAVRSEVPYSGYLFYKHAGGGGSGDDSREDVYGEALSSQAIVEQAKAFANRYGFSSFKLKAGVFPPEEEVETMRALRDAFGESTPLRIDPNCAWRNETALEVARSLHDSIEYLEDPVPGIAGMGALHKQMQEEGCGIPLASNVAVTHFDHLASALAAGAVQVVLGDHHFWGGPRAIGDLGRLCETFGLGLSMHSNSHLGVSLMAMTHVAAATPHLTYPCDTHYPWQSEKDEIVEGGRIPIIDGAVRVPKLPGLGVTLDRDQLARAHERYARSDFRKRDDTAEMRKHVDSSWTRVIPRW